MKQARLFLTMVFVWIFALAITCHADFTFNDFSNINGLSLNGDAFQFGNVLRVTPAQTNPGQVGAVWFTTKQPIQNGFETIFQFQITDLGNGGADGFAFVIQNNSTTELGNAGEGMGYDGITNPLAIEFDTWHNPGLNDPNNNHINVNACGTATNCVHHNFSLGDTGTGLGVNMSDGNIHIVRIEYVPGTLSIFVDDLINPALVVPVDISIIVPLDNGQAFVGFTAATGGAFENHDILSWSFTTTQQDEDEDEDEDDEDEEDEDEEGDEEEDDEDDEKEDDD